MMWEEGKAMSRVDLSMNDVYQYFGQEGSLVNFLDALQSRSRYFFLFLSMCDLPVFVPLLLYLVRVFLLVVVGYCAGCTPLSIS